MQLDISNFPYNAAIPLCYQTDIHADSLQYTRGFHAPPSSMTSSYVTELAMWLTKAKAAEQPRRRGDVMAVAFLAVKSDVVDARNAGYALSTIFEHMRETGRLRCNYETFRKHVKRFIDAPPDVARSPPPAAKPRAPGALPIAPRSVPASPASSARPAKPASNSPPPAAAGGSIHTSSGPTDPGGFSFDPSPNHEDLI